VSIDNDCRWHGSFRRTMKSVFRLLNTWSSCSLSPDSSRRLCVSHVSASIEIAYPKSCKLRPKIIQRGEYLVYGPAHCVDVNSVVRVSAQPAHLSPARQASRRSRSRRTLARLLNPNAQNASACASIRCRRESRSDPARSGSCQALAISSLPKRNSGVDRPAQPA
jgi:hypothetical protein